MQVQQRTAMAIAAWLEQHPAASKVHYPGLPTPPGHAIASRQQSGFGAMLSFELAGGLAEVRRFFANVRSFTLAASTGGVARLVSPPATLQIGRERYRESVCSYV